MSIDLKQSIILFCVLGLFVVAPMALAVDDTGECADLAIQAAPAEIRFCDDFDDYCATPPCTGQAPDQSLFLAEWISDGCVDAGGDPQYATISDDSRGTSVPYSLLERKGASYPNAAPGNYIFDGTSHRRDMTTVRGTSTEPLTLYFYLDLPKPGVSGNFIAAQMNRYVELTDGSDRAPAGVQIFDCGDGKFRARVPVEDGLDHDAIAIGVFAVLDTNPCSPEVRPLTYQPALYTGDRWWVLKSSIFGTDNPNGDMTLSKRNNRFRLDITSSAIDIEVVNQNGTFTAHVDLNTNLGERIYTGPFSAIHVGNGACVASPSSTYADDLAVWGGVPAPPAPTGACCLDDFSCLDATSAGCTNRFEGVYMGNGTDCASVDCGVPKGACCLPDANDSCDFLPEEECLAQNGQFNGVGTICSEVRCCLDPFADTDLDGDVDQDDFGVFQACFTGLGGGIEPGCACYDRDNNGVGDGDVDQDDYGAFERCASGPAIAADPSCDDPL